MARRAGFDCSGQFDIAKAGQPFRLIGVIADITERMTAEQVLRNQKQHLRRVLDSLFIFVGVLDLNGVLLETNHARLEADGIKPGDIVGKLLPDPYWWSYSTEVQARIWDSIHKARAGESSRFDIQARMQGGQLITLDWMIAPLRNDVGEMSSLFLPPFLFRSVNRSRRNCAKARSVTVWPSAPPMTVFGIGTSSPMIATFRLASKPSSALRTMNSKTKPPPPLI